MTTTTLDHVLEHRRELVLVEIVEAKGSTPREAGAYMLVARDLEDPAWGTIGGGQLEFMAIAEAHRLLIEGGETAELDVPLGPEIGQCCGGRTRIALTRVDDAIAGRLSHDDSERRARQPEIVLFGAGHVGLALAHALAPLPFTVTVVETRPVDAADLPLAVALRHVAMPEAEIARIRPGGAVIILTHDHALDFLIAEKALARDDLAYVGMIGSATKRATFANWLKRETGSSETIDRLVLPIGGDTVRDKRPAVIAAMVAAEMLERLL